MQLQMTVSDESDGYASSPFTAYEVEPACVDPLAVEPAQARKLARWRKASRVALRAVRDRLSAARPKIIYPQPYDIVRDMIPAAVGIMTEGGEA